MGKLETLTKKAEEMEKQLNELKAEIERAKNDWEMQPIYDYADEYFFVDPEGIVLKSRWDNMNFDINAFSQGNIFKTGEEAELEVKRRKLLTRFRAFRDDYNEGWKPDWNDTYEAKWSAVLSGGKLLALSMYCNNSFDTFGHFKNQEDCQRAIELFGEEIIELFVEA